MSLMEIPLTAITAVSLAKVGIQKGSAGGSVKAKTPNRQEGLPQW
jgi:hypothetical protein